MRVLINLKGKNKVGEIINEIQTTAGYPYSGNPGYDGLIDYLRHPDGDSMLYINKKKKINHLIKSESPYNLNHDNIKKNLSEDEKFKLKLETETELELNYVSKNSKDYDEKYKDYENSIIYNRVKSKWWDEIFTLDPELKELQIILYNAKEFREANPYKFLQNYDSKFEEVDVGGGVNVLRRKLLDRPILEEQNDYKMLIETFEQAKNEKHTVGFNYEVYDGDIPENNN